MKSKQTFLAAMGLLALLLLLPFVPEFLMTMLKINGIGAEFEKFSASGKDRIYSSLDSMLINRVAADQPIAQRVKSVNIMDGDFVGSDFSALEQLPNLEELIIYSCRNCDAIVPVINRLPRLTKITFADCGLSDAGFDQLNHPGLQSFGMSAYVKDWTEETVTRLQERMPECSLDIKAQ